MTSRLLVKPDLSGGIREVHRLTPERAGWRYVGFEVLDLVAGQTLTRELEGREQCVVLLSGRAAANVAGKDLGPIGERRDPFTGMPFALYLPPRTPLRLSAETACELAVGSAPAAGRFPARLIKPAEVSREVRGVGTNERYIHQILPETMPAEHLLVVEVLTPGGHWSSYPPHKHDVAGSGETQLEEIYYHRMRRPGGFAVQRVYTEDRAIDETLSVEDRDLVLVPRGYHPVSAAHGFDLYYLNVMAGPERSWRISTAAGYEFLTRR